MKLYYSRGACSLSSHIALREAGATFELVKVDGKTKQTETGLDFRTINPHGYVPVLELDSGERLMENAVVLQYIADQFPAAQLIPPADTMQRYRVLEWLTFVSSEIHKNYSPLFNAAVPDAYKTLVRQKLGERLSYVDRKLVDRQYLLGDAFSVADAYLFVCVNWSNATKVDLSALPNLQSFQSRVAARPAVQAALQAEGLIKKS